MSTTSDPVARDAMAIQARLAEAYLALLVALPGPGVRTMASPALVAGRTEVAIPDFNRVMVRDPAHLPPQADVDAALAAYDDTPVHSWWLPDGGARSLEPALVARGYQGGTGADVPAMWVDTAGLPEGALPVGVEIEKVSTAAQSDLFVATAAVGFGVSAPYQRPIAELFRFAVTQAGSPARMFLAFLDGRPVATALSSLAGDTVGIYNVATVPDARGRGIGGAVTLAAVLDGRTRGARVAVLESSPMGQPVYRRLGFVAAGGFRVLVSPDA
jgi:ribosomal protein S18 acetylase RimI-like enzyme